MPLAEGAVPALPPLSPRPSRARGARPSDGAARLPRLRAALSARAPARCPQPAAEMPSPAGLRALWLCAALCASPCATGTPQPGPGPAACPAPCHCQEDGIMLSADCSELGLCAVPGDLDPLTAYL